MYKSQKSYNKMRLLSIHFPVPNKKKMERFIYFLLYFWPVYFQCISLAMRCVLKLVLLVRSILFCKYYFQTTCITLSYNGQKWCCSNIHNITKRLITQLYSKHYSTQFVWILFNRTLKFSFYNIIFQVDYVQPKPTMHVMKAKINSKVMTWPNIFIWIRW